MPRSSQLPPLGSCPQHAVSEQTVGFVVTGTCSFSGLAPPSSRAPLSPALLRPLPCLSSSHFLSCFQNSLPKIPHPEKQLSVVPYFLWPKGLFQGCVVQDAVIPADVSSAAVFSVAGPRPPLLPSHMPSLLLWVCFLPHSLRNVYLFFQTQLTLFPLKPSSSPPTSARRVPRGHTWTETVLPAGRSCLRPLCLQCNLRSRIGPLFTCESSVPAGVVSWPQQVLNTRLLHLVESNEIQGINIKTYCSALAQVMAAVIRGLEFGSCPVLISEVMALGKTSGPGAGKWGRSENHLHLDFNVSCEIVRKGLF